MERGVKDMQLEHYLALQEIILFDCTLRQSLELGLHLFLGYILESFMYVSHYSTRDDHLVIP